MADAAISPVGPDVKITPVGEHTTPSNTHPRALYTGGIPSRAGDTELDDTEVIPAVPDTTLTQVPHPDTVRQMAANPKPEPFGRQMNATVEGQIPSDIELDPQVFPRAKVPGTRGSGVDNTSTASTGAGGGQAAATKAGTTPGKA